jgi:hypothetical protein
MTLVQKVSRDGLVRKARARVLVVEDDAATLHLYVTALGLSGFWPI